MKFDYISLSIGSYDIKLLLVTYWWYKQSIRKKNLLNCKKIKYFCHGFIIYWKIISSSSGFQQENEPNRSTSNAMDLIFTIFNLWLFYSHKVKHNASP